jgi:hypothetical protein
MEASSGVGPHGPAAIGPSFLAGGGGDPLCQTASAPPAPLPHSPSVARLAGETKFGSSFFRELVLPYAARSKGTGAAARAMAPWSRVLHPAGAGRLPQ